MSAQPVYQEPDPRDPQVIYDRLPAGERAEFLRQYQAAAHAAHDVTKYRDLQRLLAQWQLAADTAHDPAYAAALEEARAGGPGLTQDEVDAIRRAS